MNFYQRLIVIVGAPGSGKDLLIRAIHDMGTSHARIVPKHTSRKRWEDDGNEMVCKGDQDYRLELCDITYENYGDTYGIESSKICEALRNGVFPIVVVSNIDAINKLHEKYGDLMVLIYIHSDKKPDEYREEEKHLNKDTEYIERRCSEYRAAYKIFLENYLAFNHVLVYSEYPEDLYDQIFRLFRAYRRNDLLYSEVRSFVSEKVWNLILEQREKNDIIIHAEGLQQAGRVSAL